MWLKEVKETGFMNQGPGGKQNLTQIVQKKIIIDYLQRYRQS